MKDQTRQEPPPFVLAWTNRKPGQLIGRGHPAGDFLEAYEWRILEEREGFLRIRGHVPGHVKNPRGQMFGGFTPTYVDLVALFTVRAGEERHEQRFRTWLATTNMRVDYFEPIVGPEFVMESRLVKKRGRTAMFFPKLGVAATELEIPIMTITGDDERMEVPWKPIWTLHTNAPSPKYVIRLRETDHMTIADFLATRAMTRPLYPGYRFNFEEKAQAYKDYSVAFFDRHLKGEDTRTAILREPSNRFVELWQDTG